MRLRAMFTKEGKMRFLSHLDIVRIMERASRRANIGIKYSEGFHPTPKITFSPPVQLGTISYGELLETEADCSGAEFLERMNRVLPEGCQIIKVFELEEGAKKMSKCAMKADYEIVFENVDCEEVVIAIERYNARGVEMDEKPEEHDTTKEQSIRDRVFYLDAYENADGKAVFRCVLDATQSSILSPKALLEYFREEYGFMTDENYTVCKNELIIE
ncbi:MAG: TIGR03936 family radical SAM-associated protein [Eubacteriales bacterium]|jgi:radical SAM-linked protein